MTEPVPVRPRFSFSDLERCAKREVSKRRYVYPRAVQIGKMRSWQADHEIEMMEAIAAHFSELAKAERLL